jgi:hypothetical protein
MERVAVAMDSEWTPEIESHASVCHECSELLADRELLQEPPTLSEDALATVRTRVLKQVGHSRPPLWQAAAAVFLTAGGLTWWLTRLPDVEPLHVTVAAPTAPMPLPTRKPLRARAPEVISARPAALALALRDALEPQTAPPVSGSSAVLVAMETEDPDVLIVLVSDSKGDEE